MIARITLVALCCILMAACSPIVVPSESVDIAYRPDEPIALAPGETATLVDPVLDTIIQLTFLGVRSDSRCPNSTTSDVLCAWSGAVEVEMTAAVDGEIQTFTLIGTTDYDGVVEGSVDSETDSTVWYFAGYSFTLLQVTPYPGEERPQPDDYVTTVIVRRVTETVPTPTAVTVSVEHLIDGTGMPVVCVSEMAMAEWAAGVTQDEPFQLTPPLAYWSIPHRQVADEVCAVLFGEGWRIGTKEDVTGTWSQVIHIDTRFVTWDEDSDAVIER